MTLTTTAMMDSDCNYNSWGWWWMAAFGMFFFLAGLLILLLFLGSMKTAIANSDHDDGCQLQWQGLVTMKSDWAEPLVCFFFTGLLTFFTNTLLFSGLTNTNDTDYHHNDGFWLTTTIVGGDEWLAGPDNATSIVWAFGMFFLLIYSYCYCF